MTIASILNNFGNIDRATMIKYLKQAKEEAQSTQFNSVGPHDQNLQNRINQFNGILMVLETGKKPFSRFLTEEELQELRPTVERFVESGEFDESQFNLLYSSDKSSSQQQ